MARAIGFLGRAFGKLSASVKKGSAAAAPPTNSIAPVISGNVQVGQTLSTTDGTWTGSPSFTYQWKRAGSNIGSATNSTYLLAEADAGQAITCAVTGTNGAGNATATGNTLTIDVYVVFLAHIEDATDLTTYSGGVWNGASIGVAAANRKIVLGIVGRNGVAQTLSSVTVGGTSLAASATQTGDTGNDVAALWIANIASGTTGNVVVTWSGGMQRCGAGIWAIYGAGSSTPADTKGGNTQTVNVTLTVPAKGIGIGVSMGVLSGAGSDTWTNMTKRYDSAVESTVTHSGADLTSAAGGSISVTSSWSVAASTSAPTMTASWGP